MECNFKAKIVPRALRPCEAGSRGCFCEVCEYPLIAFSFASSYNG